MTATVDELRAHMPFDAMDAQHLQFLVRKLMLRYYASGAVVLSPKHGVVDTVWIVQRGTIRGAGGTTGSDALILSEGEMFPIGAAIAQRATVLTFTADTDTFCYQMPLAVFEHMMDVSPPFRNFATQRLAHLVAQSQRHTQNVLSHQVTNAQTLASPLQSLLRREPITLISTTPIREALLLMKLERIGSVVIVDVDKLREAIGIFTERDVLDRVAVPQIDQSRPIADVMTPSPFSLPAQAPIFEAAKVMAERRFRHVVVTNEGGLCGVISERDLFAQQRLSPGQVAKAIDRADNVQQLKSAADDVRQMALTLVAQGVAAAQLTQFVTTMNDAIGGRALAIAAAHSPPPDVPWCWLGLGSEGRMEQTLATDQDNAVIFSIAEGNEVESLRAQFLRFAEVVNGLLDSAGFPLCRGDIMAKNPRWCLTEAEWRSTFADWLRASSPDALLNGAIFFDFRPLHGDFALAKTLRNWLTEAIKTTPLFLRQMTQNALQVRPPFGVLRDFTDTDESQPGTIDLKKYGARPFIDAARIFALAHNVAATNTAERLRAVAPAMRLSQDEVGAYVDAFHFIQLQRLRLHAETSINHSNESPANPNRIRIESLNELDRRILKESLRQARKLQARLEMDFQ
jgi:CBS domain-containing protein